MSDREKVIKGLESAQVMLAKAVDRGGEMAVMSAFNCLNNVTRAIALLKEQEPVEPVPEHPVVINTLACGVCHAQVARWDTVRGKRVYLLKANFCPECGRAVKWDG